LRIQTEMTLNKSDLSATEDFKQCKSINTAQFEISTKYYPHTEYISNVCVSTKSIGFETL